MRILGISSATKVISIGLLDEDKVLIETTVSDIRAEKILFYVNEAGIKPEEIEAVAVAIGPGSYVGLRGGLATAKSLAQTLDIPLVAVSTLEAIAYNLADIEGTMAVILDAKSDEYNIALFGAHKGKLKRLTEDMVLRFDKVRDSLSRISGDIWVVGNIKGIKGIEAGNF
ncbi:MAG: tRNA (adenosine(37)-N6)-threonylcarbamoyltransferase complex dimerization subunit type 1 TsaB, partial [Candidatus Margulisbacteria bacterium]|nr:tRNA (adenosine(37)-N6)-threonylcarbamoyltransferase complex dimerization subunit type 1 TsaB [Candidatus Margulisiibacteriota bacterium]